MKSYPFFGRVIIAGCFALASLRGSTAVPTTRAELFQGDYRFKPSLRGVHPRLLFDAQDVADAITRYTKDPTSFQPYLPTPEDMAPPPSFNGNMGDVGNAARPNSSRLARLAAGYVLTGNRTYADALLRWRPALTSFEPVTFVGGNDDLAAGHVLLYLSFTYDVICHRLDNRLDVALRRAITAQAEATYRDLNRQPTFHYEQNHFTIPCAGLAVAAAALAGETPETTTWGVFSGNVLRRAFRFLSPDGWYFEGPSYWNFTAQYLVPAALAIQRVTGENPFALPPLCNTPAYLANILLPGGQFAFDFSDAGPRVQPSGGSQPGYDLPWHTLTTQFLAVAPVLLERAHPDPYLEEFLSTASFTPPQETSSSALLVFGPKPPAPHVDRQPPPAYHYFPDMEVVHWRSSWTDRNATALAFKSGPPAGHAEAALLPHFPEWRPGLGHAHPDAGTFTIFAHGMFLANGDAGYVGKKETANANSILVDGVGQADEGTAWSTFAKRPYSSYNSIGFRDVWLAPRVAAATAVFVGAAYRSDLQIATMERRLILIDGRFVLIRDAVDSRLPHQYEWRLHGDRAARSTRPGRFVMENGLGQLTVEVLQPVATASVEPTVVETELYDLKRSRPQQRGFHLALRSPPGQTAFNFLAALGIQGSGEPIESFGAEHLPNMPVRLWDRAGSCSVWMDGDPGLRGAFAYVLRDRNGAIHSVGLSGDSLESAGLSLHLQTPGQATAELTSAGGWHAAPGTVENNKLTIQVLGQPTQVLLLSP